MTDIVERLRDGWRDCHCGMTAVLEAADEIEQLRVALSQICTVCSDNAAPTCKHETGPGASFGRLPSRR